MSQAGPSRKRDQVLVACERCRAKKTKCDGNRPGCSSCFRRGVECVWETDRDPDASPITAVKRKLEQLQPQLLRHEQFIDILRNGSDAEARRAFAAIRSGSDLESALQAVRYQQQPGHPVRHEFQAIARRISRRRSITAISQHQTRSASSTPLGGISRSSAFAKQKPPRMRSSSQPPHSADSIVTSTPPYDRRIQAAQSRHWGIKYLDDDLFRSILQSWFTWDHPCFVFFDDEIFLNQLAEGQNTELCCPLSINAIIALASKNFYHIDPEKAALAEHFSLVEASKLWELSQGEAMPATIIAGLAIFLCYGLKGQDKVGASYLLQAEHLAKVMGLFRPALSAQTYSTEANSIERTKSRQAVAYGIFNFRAYLSVINDIPPLTERPAVSVPEARSNDNEPHWMPWPWSGPSRPQLKGQLFRGRCTLSMIVADILPLHRQFEHQKPSKEHYERALEIYRRLQAWYSELGSQMSLLGEESPQVIGLHNYYHLARFQLFSPFVLSPDGLESFLPDGNRLAEAGLPQNPALSAFMDALRRMRENTVHFNTQWSPRMPTPPQNFAPIIHLCMAALPDLAYDIEARYIFSLGLILCSRIAKAFFIYRRIMQTIQCVAMRKGVRLPMLAERVFAKMEKELPVLPGLDRVRSTFVVDARLRHTEVDKSTLESLTTQMEDMDVADRMALR